MNIKKGDLFEHHNRYKYMVIEIANIYSARSDYPVTITYKDLNGKVWAKTLDNFLSKMTPIKDEV